MYFSAFFGMFEIYFLTYFYVLSLHIVFYFKHHTGKHFDLHFTYARCYTNKVIIMIYDLYHLIIMQMK